MKRFLIGLLAVVGALVVIITAGVFILIKSTTFTQKEVPGNTVLRIHFADDLVEYKRGGQLAFLVGDRGSSLKAAPFAGSARARKRGGWHRLGA